MAEVYLARDRRLGRRVAVKVLRHQLAAEGKFLARFRREARAAASLRDPRIVAVHDTGSHDGCPFIVMEHVPGRTLAEVLRDEGPLDPERAAAIAEEVAGALATAHAAGIVHRDVKPSNVMVTAEGEVKMLDFGIARALRWTPLTDTPGAHGTPEYLSPEQARGEAVDGRSDVYSLGVVLYEMLTGRPPFSGESAVGVAYKHVEEAPPPVEVLRPDAPPALAAIALRCLAKHPADRFGRAGELRAELARFRAGEPPGTAPFPVRGDTARLHRWRDTPRELLRPRRRIRRAVGVMLVVLAAVAGNLVVGLFVLPRFEPVRHTRPQPLHPPTSLTATAECSGFLEARVSLAWRSTRSGVARGYEVYRGTHSGGPYQRVGVLAVPSTTFIETGLDPGTRYFYVVRATAGTRTSQPSGQAQAETPLVCLW
jgi:serine/threonine-protein kinase